MLEIKKHIPIVLKCILCLHCCMALVHSAHSQITSPTELEGLSAWWCADSVQQDDGTAVSIWYNMANTTESVTQAVPENCPTLVKEISELNNHAVLRFDGNDYLNGGDIMNVGTMGQTAFVVAKSNGNNGNFFSKSLAGLGKCRYYCMYENKKPTFLAQYGSRYFGPIGQSKLGEYDLLSTQIDLKHSLLSFFQNEVGLKQMETEILNSFSSAYLFLIGAYNNNVGAIPPNSSYYLNGDIAEMIFYNRPLSNIERQTVENYLRSKYFPGTEREQFSLGSTIIKQEYSLKPIELIVPDRAYFQKIAWSTGESTQSISVNKSDLYAVHVTDDWGYDYIDTVNVVFPSFSYIPSQTICDGQSVVWNCGLSGDYTYEWSSGETTQAITITQAGKYAVKVTDNQGYSIVSDTVTIEVDDFSTMAKLGTDTTLCIGNSIGLVSHANEAIQFSWNTGETSPTIAIAEAGTYSLSATNALGCVATDDITVAIKGTAPAVSYVAQHLCEGDATELISNSYTTDNTAITTTQWVVEDDTINGTVQTHTFSSYGDFVVKIAVTNDDGCVQELQDTITIHPLPIAKFSPKISCQYTANEISSTSTIPSGIIASYEWSGLPQKSNDSAIWFRKDEAGSYPLMLKVVSDFGCMAEIQDNVEVRPSQKIDFIHSRNCLNDTIMFFDVTKYVSYNPIVESYWSYDGKKYSYRNVFMSLLKDTLPHTISLHIKTLNGCMNIASDTIKAHDLPHPLVEDLQYGCKNKEIAFANNGYSVDSVAKQIWHIGDEIYEEETPFVEFKRSGEFEVTLEQITEFGCKNSSTGIVVIEKNPIVAFSFYPEYGAAPLDVQFTNLSEGAISYVWTFEQSFVTEDENPAYTFEDKTNSYAKLRASSEHGCADSVIKQIPVQLSDMQLQVTEINATLQNDMIQYVVQVLNSGNDIIPEIEMTLSGPDFLSLSETWYGNLKPNEVQTYVFSAKTKALNNQVPAYVCATATISSSSQNKTFYTDSYCKDFSKKFNVYSVSPNPVKDIALLSFSTTLTERIVVECIDEFGKIRFNQEFSSLLPGFHTCRIDMSQLPAGIYIMCVQQGNQKEFVQIIKK